MKLISQIFIVALVMLITQNVKALTISPGTITLETTPNEIKPITIKVFNEGKHTIVVTPSYSDFDYNKKGKKYFHNKKSKIFSLGSYLSMSKEPFYLEPRESKEVYLSLKVPEGVAGGNHGVIFFHATQFQPDHKKFKSKVSVAIKLGATIYQEDSKTSVVSSKIKSIDIDTSDNQKVKVNLKVKNEGNTYIKASGVVAVLGNNEKFLGSFKLSEEYILRGKENILVGELKKKLASGNYNAIITYQYRDKNITVNKSFSIK